MLFSEVSSSSTVGLKNIPLSNDLAFDKVLKIAAWNATIRVEKEHEPPLFFEHYKSISKNIYVLRKKETFCD